MINDDPKNRQQAFALNMTPERKARLRGVCNEVVELLRYRLKDPLEALSCLELTRKSMEELLGVTFDGLVLVSHEEMGHSTQQRPDSPPTFRHKESRCPTCNMKLDAGQAVLGKGVPPVAGDFSICINCGEFLTFSADLTLRKARMEEFDAQDAEARDVLVQGREFILQRGRIA